MLLNSRQVSVKKKFNKIIILALRFNIVKSFTSEEGNKMVNIALLELTYGMFDSNIIECEGCDAELNIFSRRSHVSSLLVDA